MVVFALQNLLDGGLARAASQPVAERSARRARARRGRSGDGIFRAPKSIHASKCPLHRQSLSQRDKLHLHLAYEGNLELLCRTGLF